MVNGSGHNQDMTQGRMGPQCRASWQQKLLDGRAWAMLVMLLCAALSLTACDNSPYPAGATEANTLYTAFNERSPRYLDPTSSYSKIGRAHV